LGMMYAAMICAALLPGAFGGTDPAVQFEVEQTLSNMAAAAISGDAAGYLEYIDRADPEFFNEQKYFANDLSKKPPESLTFEVGEVSAGDGAAEGMLTVSWTMPGAKPREVSFGAKFVQGQAGWVYAGETWERHAAPGVLVLCDPGLDELADRTVEAFSAVRAGVEEGFGLADAPLARKTQKIKLFGSVKHLQVSICLSYEDGLGGWNEPGEPIKLLAGERTKDASLRRLLAHEYGHVATFELGDKANLMPWWVLEGVAELSAEKFATRRSGSVENWARAGRLAPWEEIADFEKTSRKFMRNVYAQGHSMVAYISERWGADARNQWLRAMSQGASIDQATRAVMAMGFEELSVAWRATLPAEGEEAPVEPGEPKAAKPDTKEAPAKGPGGL